jgi:membrane associated rhomboid family serine protease
MFFRATPFHRQMMWVCGLVYALEVLVGSADAIQAGAVYGPDVSQGQWWRLVTAGFLHASTLHLAVNMFSLYALGRIIEPAFTGKQAWRFPLLYIGSLLGGSFGALLVEFDRPAVGASGAIFGLLGAALTIPRRLGLGWNKLGVLPWLVVNLLITFAVPNISKGGHIGGLVAGLVLGWVLTTPLKRTYGDINRLSVDQ